MKPKRRRADTQRPTKTAIRRTSTITEALAEVGEQRRASLLRAAARQPVVRVQLPPTAPAPADPQLPLWG